MTLRNAHKRAAELNRAEEAKGSRTRFVVCADPVGSCDGRYQLISRQVGATRRQLASAR